VLYIADAFFSAREADLGWEVTGGPAQENARKPRAALQLTSRQAAFGQAMTDATHAHERLERQADER
jgi:hypothetical protein